MALEISLLETKITFGFLVFHDKYHSGKEILSEDFRRSITKKYPSKNGIFEEDFSSAMGKKLS